MVRYKNTIWCDSCGIEIRWMPIKDGRFLYCCEVCKNGFQCDCDDRHDEDEFLFEKKPKKIPLNMQ